MHITLLGGQVRLDTSPQVPNPSEDAVWLAAALPDDGSRYFEAGLGTGAASFCTLVRLPQAHIVGLEKQAPMQEAAAHNLTLNPALAARLQITPGDISTYTPSQPFDHSFANLPFYEPAAGFKSQHPVRDLAHGLGETPLGDWWQGLKRATRQGGSITVIGHAQQVPSFLEFFKEHQSIILWAHTHATRPPKRAIMQAWLTPGDLQEGHFYTHDPALRAACLQQPGALMPRVTLTKTQV